MPNLTKELAYWITERYAIKLRRDDGAPKPWSSDPIFQSVRFCNVHREDDTVTQWIRENWNKAGDPAWKFVLGRMINWVPTLATLVGQFGINPITSIEDIKATLKNTRALGEKVFTSAYTISTCGKSMDKIDYVCDWVCRDVQRAEANEIWPNYHTLESAWTGLCQIDGLGSFLAAQVVADMKNTKGHPLADAHDWWTWSAPGPGSLRGLNWYFYQAPEGPVRPNTYQAFLADCVEEVTPRINASVPRISNQDFQNCLCEFSKYMKVKMLGGHVRNKYAGS